MLLLIGAAIVVAVSSTSCVPTGHVGVVTVFGRVTARTLTEGIHVVNPAANATELSTERQEVKEHASVPSQEGLIMGLEASLLYHLDPACAGDVFSRSALTMPRCCCSRRFDSAMRAITAGHTAAALYSDAREATSRLIQDVARQVTPRGIIVENVLLRDCNSCWRCSSRSPGEVTTIGDDVNSEALKSSGRYWRAMRCISSI